jgi:anti-sigma factor RsiW
VDEAHRHQQEELAAYLLGALSDEEARDFERHLRTCASCQEEERWLRGAVELLPSSVEQVEPSPHLRERLMATVRAEADTSAERRVAPARRAERSRFGLRWGLLRPAAALGAVLALAAGIGGYLIGSSESGPGTTTVAVQPTTGASGVAGRIVKSEDAAVLTVRGLESPGRGRVDQVWLLREGADRPEPSALFSVDREGSGAAGIPSDLDGVRQVMVSSEPDRGSTQPTTQPVLTANL